MGLPRARIYRPEDQANLGDFDCCANPDDPKEYEIEINDWIRDIPPGTIAGELQTREVEEVHLYEITENDHTRIIAYGVLAAEKWSLETGPATVEQTEVSVIAMLGLHRDFQGKRVGGPESERYSTVIFQDLLAMAARRCGSRGVIGLYVHPDNTKAVRLYENHGFEKLDYIEYHSERFNKTYHLMALYLPSSDQA